MATDTFGCVIERLICTALACHPCDLQPSGTAGITPTTPTPASSTTKVLVRIVTGMVKDDAELFKQFMENEDFKRWMAASICLPGDSAKMRAENGSEPGMPGLAPEVTLAGRWLHTGRLHGHGAAVAVEYKCSGGGRPCRSVTTERGAVGAPAEHVWQ